MKNLQKFITTKLQVHINNNGYKLPFTILTRDFSVKKPNLARDVEHSLALPSTEYLHNIIPSTYISSRNKPLIVYFTIFDLNNSSLFNNRIISTIPKGFIYTVFVKIRYNYDSFFMAGNQFGFDFSSSVNIDYLLYNINTRLDEYFDVYNLSNESIIYIQVSFRKMDTKLLSEFYLHKPDHVSIYDNIITQKKLNIPLSVNEVSLGSPLAVETHNGFITKIFVTIYNKQVNFLDVIKNKAKFLRSSHKDNITLFDTNFKFYLLMDNSYYVLAVKFIGEYSIEKIRYSLDGVVINHVIDEIVDKQIVRKSNEKEIVLEGNKVVTVKQNIKLKAIVKPKSKVLFVENRNIGVINSETYKSKDNTYKIYAIGFKTNLADVSVIYYIDKTDLNTSKLIISMVDELLKAKYSNITFYCHNLGGFDIVFILKVLYNYNDNHNDKYKISCILRDDKIIKVTIGKDKHSFTIMDSYCVLSDSLRKLGESFEVNTLKSRFPYDFATEDHLFYKGDTPSINYFDNISTEEYNNISSDSWSFYDESIKYLKNDLISLYEIMIKANKQIFMDYDVNLTDNLTVSGLAVRIFLKDYYNNNIPNINKSSIYRDIKEGYYGGITEVYKPTGYNLFYYDVNSWYTYVSLQDMPGLECSKVQFYTNTQDI